MVSNNGLLKGFLPCEILVAGETGYVGPLLLHLVLGPTSASMTVIKGKMIVKWGRARAGWNPQVQGGNHRGIAPPPSLQLC